MAKDTKAKLVADAQRKLKAARDAQEAAKAKFEAAQNDTDREAAQKALNDATADAERYAKMAEALSGKAPAEDDEPTKRPFVCVGAIRHNGDDYAEGDEIELTKVEFDALPAGAVVAI